jgi:hypothetical protein
MLATDNPRLTEVIEGQRDLIRAIVENQKDKLLKLAADIVENGLNPSDRPLVVQAPGDPSRYIVLEGNRRVAAVRILESPDVIDGAVSPTLDKRFRTLSREYLSDPIDSVDCVVFDSIEEADHWRELRHTGENEGAGVVGWGAAEQLRFRSRRGKKKEYSLQALDFLVSSGEMEPEEANAVPITSLKRLLSNPQIRDRLGLEMEHGTLYTRFDTAEVAASLGYIARDLASGRVRTGDIYYRQQRLNYINELDESIFPDTSQPTAARRTLEEAAQSEAVARKQKGGPPKRRSVSIKRKRDRLIPRQCVLQISNARVNEIYRELKQLKVSEFPNAVSVLFRVFLELSLDEYRDAHNLGDSGKPLRFKLESVAKHLEQAGKLKVHQARAIRRMAAPDTFLASSVRTLHEYVHSPDISVGPDDLRTGWDNLEQLFRILWP